MSLLAVPTFGSLAVTRYMPDAVRSWTNSPFLSVLVVSLRPEPSSDSTVIVTFGTGCCLASITLPRTIVDCASAGAAIDSAIRTAVTRAVSICLIGV